MSVAAHDRSDTQNGPHLQRRALGFVYVISTTIFAVDQVVIIS